MSFTVRLLAGGLAVASGLICAGSARAVILYQDETRNEAPSSDSVAYSAWQFQGQFGSFLGTPIAPNYFVTAAHVGTQTGQLVFQGTSYAVDKSFGSSGRMIVPGTDLAIWKVDGTFSTYTPLYTGSDEVGQHIVVVGRGTARGSEVRDGEELRGWLWGAADRKQSWGENDVSGIVNGGQQLGDLLQFDFDAGDLPNECALSSGDSGGGVFIQDAGVWKLAGINYSVSGPYSRSSSGADSFLGSLFDLQGLYVQVDQNTWRPGYGPGSSYASRISTQASAIYSLVPRCPVVQREYTVRGVADMGTVDVTGKTQVGQGAVPGLLKATYVRGNALEIGAGSQVVIHPNGTDTGTSRVTTLSIDEGGRLDLTNNSLIVQADAATRDAVLAEISTLIGKGRNSGPELWQGNGITSSMAADDSLTGLAIILNDRGNGVPVLSTFGGQEVDINSILVKYTWNGDVTLDGKVDLADYFLVDAGFITQKGGYRNGDLNYDGTVDLADYFLIDKAFIGQTGGWPGTGSGLSMTAVPEPGVVGLLALVGVAGACRRFRR